VVADLTEGADNGLADVPVGVGKKLGQSRDGGLVADLAEVSGGDLAHVPVGVAEGRDQGLGGVRPTDGAEQSGGILAHSRQLVVEEVTNRGDSLFADLLQSLARFFAQRSHAGGKPLDEGVEVLGLDHLADFISHRVSDRLGRVQPQLISLEGRSLGCVGSRVKGAGAIGARGDSSDLTVEHAWRSTRSLNGRQSRPAALGQERSSSRTLSGGDRGPPRGVASLESVEEEPAAEDRHGPGAVGLGRTELDRSAGDGVDL